MGRSTESWGVFVLALSFKLGFAMYRACAYLHKASLSMCQENEHLSTPLTEFSMISVIRPSQVPSKASLGLFMTVIAFGVAHDCDETWFRSLSGRCVPSNVSLFAGQTSSDDSSARQSPGVCATPNSATQYPMMGLTSEDCEYGDGKHFETDVLGGSTRRRSVVKP